MKIISLIFFTVKFLVLTEKPSKYPHVQKYLSVMLTPYNMLHVGIGRKKMYLNINYG